MINMPELFQLFQKNAATTFAQEIEKLEDNNRLACQIYVYDEQPVEGTVRSCVEGLARAMPKYADYSMPPRSQPGTGGVFYYFDNAIVPFRVVIADSMNLPTGEYYNELGEKIPILKPGHVVIADAFVSEK